MAWVEKAMSVFDCPGAAIGVVKGDELWTQGFGTKEAGTTQPVDAQTMFAIASNSKAFTAAAMAILVDEKKVAWDDKVIKHLPGFSMWDYYVTREVDFVYCYLLTSQLTVRDLFCHRAGLSLGAGDLMFWPETDFTSDQIIDRIKFLKPTISFRSEFAYDNILYGVAGKIIEVVSGLSWFDFVKAKIFVPAGMTSSNTSSRQFKEGDNNIAKPHARHNGKNIPVGYESLDNNAAAGAINSNAQDMIQWLRLQLSGGKIGGNDVFSTQQRDEMWKSQTILPNHHRLPGLVPNFSTYCLGWASRDYRGLKVIYHTGGLIGQISRVVLLPQLNLGLVALTNAEIAELLEVISYQIIDHFIDGKTVEELKLATECTWIEDGLKAQKIGQERIKSAENEYRKKRRENTRPSLPLEEYTGVYTDAWYGDVFIKPDDEGLIIKFSHTPKLEGKLVHWHLDTFVAEWYIRELNADAFVTFSINAEGEIEKFLMKPVSPLVDFSYDFVDLLLIKQAK